MTRVLSAKEAAVLEAVARLEYAVARGMLSRAEALARARAQRLPPELLDVLEREPGQAGYAELPRRSAQDGGKIAQAWLVRLPDPDRTPAPVETETTKRLRDLPFSSVLAKRPLGEAQATALFEEFSRRLGVRVGLEWAEECEGVWVDPREGREIVIPGGLVRQPAIYEDSLALIVGHELSHIEGHHKDEARADYEGARYTLPKLLDVTSEDDYFERAMLAAYGVALYLGRLGSEPLQLRSPDDPPLVVHPSGYPSLQSRWDLFKAGILGRPMLRTCEA